jgi:hypothetical protein
LTKVNAHHFTVEEILVRNQQHSLARLVESKIKEQREAQRHLFAQLFADIEKNSQTSVKNRKKKKSNKKKQDQKKDLKDDNEESKESQRVPEDASGEAMFNPQDFLDPHEEQDDD